jgi:hypothetical protein
MSINPEKPGKNQKRTNHFLPPFQRDAFLYVLVCHPIEFRFKKVVTDPRIIEMLASDLPGNVKIHSSHASRIENAADPS